MLHNIYIYNSEDLNQVECVLLLSFVYCGNSQKISYRDKDNIKQNGDGV